MMVEIRMVVVMEKVMVVIEMFARLVVTMMVVALVHSL